MSRLETAPKTRFFLALASFSMLASTSALACSVHGADTFDSSITVQNELARDVALTGWEGLVGPGPEVSPCPRTDLGLITVTKMRQLSFVRYIEVDGQRYPAYGWNSASPLIIFRAHKSAAPSPNTPTPLTANDTNRYTARTSEISVGGGEHVRIRMHYRLFSRGGPMNGVESNILKAYTYLQGHINDGNIEHTLSLAISIPRLTCRLDNVTVALPDVRASELPVVHSDAGTRQFQVMMDCPSDRVPVQLTLNDAAAATNTGSELTPGAGSTSKGVAVQLLRDGKPVTFGQTWKHSNVRAGANAIPFAARYLRTGDDLSAGTLEGKAILRADYQ
ncbi:fimbrial protein [Stenotrophomonas sp. WHRI 8082]|uniref:fimbrial protein n=1 Tax=Stenotrophomonas sp. WHRI 8082 TaxID=3162571 RepID=UPI0032EAB559